MSLMRTAPYAERIVAPDESVPNSIDPLEVTASTDPATEPTMIGPSAPLRRRPPPTWVRRADPDLKVKSASPLTRPMRNSPWPPFTSSRSRPVRR